MTAAELLPQVSMVESAMAKKTEFVAAGAVIKAIKGSKYRRKVQEIRKVYQQALVEHGGDHAKAKRAVDSLKKRLPGIMWSGTFSARCDKNLSQYSGLLCADFDHIETPPELYEKLRTDQHICAAFKSPTDTGMKVVFRVGGTAERHREYFLAVKDYAAKTYGLLVDEACKNVERLCFVSCDESAFYNPQPVPLPPAERVETKTVATTVVSINERQRIAEKLLGAINWKDGDAGLCQCPGAHLHTSGNGARDCKVWVGSGSVPSASCFHESCRGMLAGVNHELRSQIAKAEYAPITNGKSTAGAKDDADTEFEFANRLAETLPPIKTCGSRWHAYRDGTWGEIDRNTLRPNAQNILPVAIRTDRRASALLDHIEGRCQISADSFSGFYKFNERGDVLLNASNGVVRVNPAGEIILDPHVPAHLFTQKLAANYQPEAKCQLFTRVLGEAVPDLADQTVFQLCAGNFFYPDCRYEVALVQYGAAGSGKSTIADSIANVMGNANVSRLTLAQICDPKSYHLPKLRFAAVNLGTELDAVEVGESGAFKTIVSGEAIEARPIYGAPFTMTTTCKLWFLANCLPRFKHGTEAELRRTRFIRFDHVPAKKDVTLKSKLALERDGIFNWMLAGLVELISIPHIPLGGAHSRRVHDRFRISNDPVGAFVAERCVLEPAQRVSKETLSVEYREFCERNELPPGHKDWFFRGLYDRWTDLREIRTNEGGDRRRFVSGIALKSPEGPTSPTIYCTNNNGG